MNSYSFLDKETSLIVYFDLANMFHWQDHLGWKFRIEDLIEQLFSIQSVKEIKVYYGLNERDKENSEGFHKRIRKTGAILRTKPVKFIRKTVNKALFFKKSTLNLFDHQVNNKITNLINSIYKLGIIIEEPKCNFDVEMTMDMIDDLDKVTGIMLFSGDSDLLAPLERLKIKKKNIYIFGVRGMVAAELHKIKNVYIDFGKFYQGKKRYL